MRPSLDPGPEFAATLTKAFDHVELGLVDAFVVYKGLDN
jgi:hypothetical protein